MENSNYTLGDSLITLQAKKVKIFEKGICFTKTEIYQNGKLKATFDIFSKQPKKGQKTIILNCWEWKLKW